MNRYILIRRLQGPMILLLLGVIALLHQAGLAHWSLFVPLLLILIGVLKLAERATLASMGDDAPFPGPYPNAYPGTYPGTGYPYGTAPAQPGATAGTTQTQGSGTGPEGGQS